jgi:hypothetical protein
VTLTPGQSIADIRERLSAPQLGWVHGSQPALAAAIKVALTGTKHVRFEPAYEGHPFHLAVYTLEAETTSPTTWGQLEAIAPTWGDFDEYGTWANLEAVWATQVAALPEKPAGWRIIHLFEP